MTEHGRRRRTDGGRHRVMKLRFTDAELAEIAVRAAACGFTPTSYVATRALRPEGLSENELLSAVTNLVGVRRLLSGVANNLNQMTAALHATGALSPAAPALITAVSRVTDRADVLAAELSRHLGIRRR